MNNVIYVDNENSIISYSISNEEVIFIKVTIENGVNKTETGTWYLTTDRNILVRIGDKVNNIRVVVDIHVENTILIVTYITYDGNDNNDFCLAI